MITRIRPGTSRVSFHVGKRKYVDKVKITRCVPEVGHYVKRRPHTILIDGKLPSRSRKPVTVHEAVEIYDRYTLHEPVWKAHRDALRVEHLWNRRHHVNEKQEMRDVDRVFRENWRRGVIRRK